MATVGGLSRIFPVSESIQNRRNGARLWIGVWAWILAWVACDRILASELRFGGPEIFPVDPRIEHLGSADFDRDGFHDLLVINPRKSRIQILYNQTSRLEKLNAEPPEEEFEINDLPPDARFRLESISTEERVTSVMAIEFSGDERVDIVYCGNTEEVVLLENRMRQGWSEVKKWTVPSIIPNRSAMQVGDFDGNGVDELVVLTESYFYFIDRPKGAGNVRPQRLLHSGNLASFRVVDLDGDGRDDLMCRTSGNSKHQVLRFGTEDGISQSEFLVDVGLNRFFGAINSEKGDLVAISQRSGRAKIGRVESVAVEPLRDEGGDGQMVRVTLPESRQLDRGVLNVDVNDDELPDLIVADSVAGKLLVSLLGENRAYGTPREFGTYGGVGQLKGIDWDGDGQLELFLLSYTENQVGVTEFRGDEGVEFPTRINLHGIPLGIAAGALKLDDLPKLLVLERAEDELYLVVVSSDSHETRQKLALSLDASRVKLVLHDVDQDGFQDVVVLASYEDLWILRQVPGEDRFEPVKVNGGIRDLERPWVSRIDVDGDGKRELVLPQKNAVRGMVLENQGGIEGGPSSWVSRIKVQINGIESRSIIGGAVAIPMGAGEAPMVCLLDVGTNQLSCQQRGEGGQWELKASFALPAGDYLGMEDQISFAAGLPSLRLIERSGALVKFLNGERWAFEVAGTYESKASGGFLRSCLGATFDRDRSADLVFLETAENHVEIVSFDSDAGSKLVLRWPVFEERSFRNRRNEFPEPREVLVGDFTGDGSPDIALIVHDRILLYPRL